MPKGIGYYPVKPSRAKKLKHPLTPEVLKHFAASGLTMSGLADKYGVTITHFRRLIQDRVSLNEAIKQGYDEYAKAHPTELVGGRF